MPEKVLIPTAKIRQMIEQPYLRVEAPEHNNAWTGRKEFTFEEQREALSEIRRGIVRHVDGVGHVQLVANEVMVCRWCKNPADDCEQDGPDAGAPICCDEAVEEYVLKYRKKEQDNA